MKTKQLLTAVLTAAFALPLAAHAADTKSTTENVKEAVSDSAITAKIKAEYAKDKDVSATKIKVDTDNKGIVTLSGTAKSKAEADKAAMIARDTKGVAS